MSRRKWLLGSLALTSLALAALNRKPPPPVPVAVHFPALDHVRERGARTLGMDMNDAAEDLSFDEGVRLVQRMGVEVTMLHLPWDQVEPEAGRFVDPYGGALAVINLYCPPHKLRVSLTLSPLNSGAIALPTDLKAEPVDSPRTVERFRRMLDFVVARIPDVELINLQIGNELDLDVRASQAEFWESYERFLKAVLADRPPRLRAVKVGFTATADGLLGRGKGGLVARAGLERLARVVDVIGVTYYPMGENCRVRPASTVLPDLTALAEHYPRRPLFFQEVGLPTSAQCESSPAQQVEILHAFFSAWDRLAERIPFAALLRLNDWDEGKSRDYARSIGFGGNAYLIEYLRTLGLRTWDKPSSPKPALMLIERELEARHWAFR